MKKKIFAPLLGAVVLGLSAYAGYRTYDAYAGNSEDDLLLANAEALANVEGNNLWFANLRNVECTLTKINMGGAFYYKNVLIPAGATYTAYGSKWKCKREFTLNTCSTSNETSCE